MKIQRISEFQHEIPFLLFNNHPKKYCTAFLASDLGKIYRSILWCSLVDVLGLKDHNKGSNSIFPQGKITLMFLKHYTYCSNSKLISQLNANIDYQQFCDIYIPSSQQLTNYKIVSKICCDIAHRLDLDKAQAVLIQNWLSFMEDLNSITCDATCYESSIRYPTNIKFL